MQYLLDIVHQLSYIHQFITIISLSLSQREKRDDGGLHSHGWLSSSTSSTSSCRPDKDEEQEKCTRHSVIAKRRKRLLVVVVTTIDVIVVKRTGELFQSYQ